MSNLMEDIPFCLWNIQKQIVYYPSAYAWWYTFQPDCRKATVRLRLLSSNFHKQGLGCYPSDSPQWTQDRQYTYNVKLKRFRATCCSGKEMSITYSECLRSLVIRHSMPMSHIVIGVLPGPTIFFPRYLTNGKIFEKKLLNKKGVLWFPLQRLSKYFSS